MLHLQSWRHVRLPRWVRVINATTVTTLNHQPRTTRSTPTSNNHPDNTAHTDWIISIILFIYCHYHYYYVGCVHSRKRNIMVWRMSACPIGIFTVTHQNKQTEKNLNFTKYALHLYRADLIILIGLLTSHADFNRHLTLMQIRTDATCPLCQEDKETVLHLLGECSTVKCLNILDFPYPSYEELGNVHWQVLSRLAKATVFLTHLGMWGCALGPSEASAQMTTSTQKKKK